MIRFFVARANLDRQAGFSLLETLLSVAVMGFMSLVAVQLMHGWAKDQQAEAAANYMEIIHTAATDMVGKYAQFDILYDQAAASGGIIQIPILGDPALLGVPFTIEQGGPPAAAETIPGSLMVSPAFMDRNPLRQPLTVVVRVADRPATSDERVLDILLVSTAPADEKLVRRTAEAIGGKAGLISALQPTDPARCLPVGCAQTIRSAFGDWILDVNAFAGTAWGAGVLAAPPTLATGAYLVVYRNITENEAAGDYLYRRAFPEKPDLNAMHTDLQMSENSIIGTDNVFAQTLEVSEYIAAQGSVHIAGNLGTLEMKVEDDLAAGELRFVRTYNENDPRIDESQISDPRALLTNATQSIVIEGELSAQNLNANTIAAAMPVQLNELARGTIQADIVRTTSLDATGGSGIYVSDSLSADGVDVSGNFYGGSLTAENVIRQRNGAGVPVPMTTEVTGANVTGNLEVSGDMSADTLTIDSMSINRLTSCVDGCVP